MMPFHRWLALIGVMVVVGAAQVAQQTAIRLKAYELGHQDAAFHQVESETLWLKTRVVGLRSPARLAKAMTNERLKLVAWSALNPNPKSAQLARADHSLQTAELSE